MYLAREHLNGKIYYSIRESYGDKEHLKSRDFFKKVPPGAAP